MLMILLGGHDRARGDGRPGRRAAAAGGEASSSAVSCSSSSSRSARRRSIGRESLDRARFGARDSRAPAARSAGRHEERRPQRRGQRVRGGGCDLAGTGCCQRKRGEHRGAGDEAEIAGESQQPRRRPAPVGRGRVQNAGVVGGEEQLVAGSEQHGARDVSRQPPRPGEQGERERPRGASRRVRPMSSGACRTGRPRVRPARRCRSKRAVRPP